MKSLDIACCYLIDDHGIIYLPSSLESLNMGGLDNITDSGMKSVAKLSNINSLNFSACRGITEIGVGYVYDNSNLRTGTVRTNSRLRSSSRPLTTSGRTTSSREDLINSEED